VTTIADDRDRLGKTRSQLRIADGNPLELISPDRQIQTRQMRDPVRGKEIVIVDRDSVPGTLSASSAKFKRHLGHDTRAFLPKDLFPKVLLHLDFTDDKTIIE
jgi:hypothetical protein